MAVGQWAEAKMVLLTMIARVADGLPLAASMQEDEQVGRGVLAWTGPARPGPVRSGSARPGRTSLAAFLQTATRPRRPPRPALSRAVGTRVGGVCRVTVAADSLSSPHSPAATSSSTRARRSSCSAS